MAEVDTDCWAWPYAGPCDNPNCDECNTAESGTSANARPGDTTTDPVWPEGAADVSVWATPFAGE